MNNADLHAQKFYSSRKKPFLFQCYQREHSENLQECFDKLSFSFWCES